MPGWAAATELLHRDKHHPTSAIEVTNAAILASEALTQLKDEHGLSLVVASVNLAATARKLLWPHVQCMTPAAALAWRGLRSSKQHRRQQEKGRSLGFLQKSDLVTRLCISLLSLDCVLASSRYTCNISNTISVGSMGGRDNTAIPGTQLRQNSSCGRTCRHERKISATTSKGDGTGACPSHVCCIKQLLAITTLTVLQIYLSRWECEVATPNDATPPWLAEVRQAIGSLQDQDMRALGTTLLSDLSSAPRTQSEVGLLWEKYAVEHLHGRLVPGCCNLGCNNLDGFSEAALGTNLCSGCRRARYCCVECQKAAWVEGGHRDVCGE